MAYGIGVTRTLGLDLSDKTFASCLLSESGEVLERKKKEPLTKERLTELLDCERVRVVLEAGTSSAWVSELVTGLGHEALVANPREIPSISKSKRKSDVEDAEKLARLGRADPKLLSPIRHRREETRLDLTIVRARATLVETRTKLVNAVRGLSKTFGERVPKCSTYSFHKSARQGLSESVLTRLEPLIRTIESLNAEIKGMDATIEELSEGKYRQTEQLRQVAGVGSVTALTFLLVLEDYQRFKTSRAVGPYLGLVPRLDQSGEIDRQLGISKHGDGMLRSLLVGSAHYVLGPFGPDCDLRRWGHELAKRGGKNAKKRAATAVARRLAVLLHSLWKTGEVYEPLRRARNAGGPQEQHKSKTWKLRPNRE